MTMTEMGRQVIIPIMGDHAECHSVVSIILPRDAY